MSEVLTDRTALTTPATGDFLHVVDVSDTTDATTGTSKKITYTNLTGGATQAELAYVSGVTSAIQTQMNLKAPLASPTLVTPVLGVATATTINKVTITAPATASTLTIAQGSSLITAGAYAITLTATAATGVTLPTTGTLATLAGTETLTNKRNTKRVVTTTDDASAVINTDITDEYELSAVANATTFTLTGTPTDGQVLIVRFKDAGVTKGLTWTGFTAIGVTLPTDTTAGKWHYVGCKYNLGDTAWHAIAVTEEA